MSIHFERIFKNASTTYYYSSIFFPKDTKKDIFALYAFVRTADNLVDRIPQDKEGFLKFKKESLDVLLGKKDSSNNIINAFKELSSRKNLDIKWTISFLEAMESDLTKKTYNTLEELEKYVHGSAEVIGLMICRIIGIKEEYHDGAKKLGHSMQLINFIRDIEEDNTLGRTYIPKEKYSSYGLLNLSKKEALMHKKEFIKIIRNEIDNYVTLRKEAHLAFKGIPYRQRVPIKTASDLYYWTSRKIYENPFIVYKKKVKPTKIRVLLYICKNTIFPW